MANKGMQGMVIDQMGPRVKVRVFRANTCENCDCVLKDACDLDTPPPRGMFDIFADRSVLELEATNVAGASVGDRIVVKLKDDTSLVKGAFWVYLLPGVLFLLGLFGGGWLGRTYGQLDGDALILAQLAGGVVMLGVSFVYVRVQLMLKGAQEFIPEVTEIVTRAQPDPALHPG